MSDLEIGEDDFDFMFLFENENTFTNSILAENTHERRDRDQQNPVSKRKIAKISKDVDPRIRCTYSIIRAFNTGDLEYLRQKILDLCSQDCSISGFHNASNTVHSTTNSECNKPMPQRIGVDFVVMFWERFVDAFPDGVITVLRTSIKKYHDSDMIEFKINFSGTQLQTTGFRTEGPVEPMELTLYNEDGETKQSPDVDSVGKLLMVLDSSNKISAMVFVCDRQKKPIGIITHK